VLSVNDVKRTRMFLRIICYSFVSRKPKTSLHNIFLLETPCVTVFYSIYGRLGAWSATGVLCTRTPFGRRPTLQVCIPTSIAVFFPLPLPDANLIRPWLIRIHTAAARCTYINVLFIVIIIIHVDYYFRYLEHAAAHGILSRESYV